MIYDILKLIIVIGAIVFMIYYCHQCSNENSIFYVDEDETIRKLTSTDCDDCCYDAGTYCRLYSCYLGKDKYDKKL